MRYVNDKYREHYKNIERKERYKDDKKDYSWIIIVTLAIGCIFFLFMIMAAASISSENRSAREKDKFVKIETNSLGCTKYRYNGDIVWSCPDNIKINQIETEVCTGSRPRTCKTHYDPVVSR